MYVPAKMYYRDIDLYGCWDCEGVIVEESGVQSYPLPGAVVIAHNTNKQATVAGKHLVGMEMFRGSSQDGQYMPWDEEGSETLKLDGVRSPDGQPPINAEPTSSPPMLRVTPTTSNGANFVAQNSGVAPTLEQASPKKKSPSKKGWKDLRPTKGDMEPDSPDSHVARLHHELLQCLPCDIHILYSCL